MNLNTSISDLGLTNGDYVFVRKIDPNRRRELQECIVLLGRKKQGFANFPVRQNEHTNRSLYLAVDRKLGAAESLAIDEMRFLELKCTLSIEANKPISKSPIKRARGFEARIKIENFEFLSPYCSTRGHVNVQADFRNRREWLALKSNTRNSPYSSSLTIFSLPTNPQLSTMSKLAIPFLQTLPTPSFLSSPFRNDQ